MPEAAAPPLGVVMLDTQFPRVPGDIGNPASFPFPVTYELVPGASAERVVAGRAARLVDAFVAAGQRLADRGAVGILTSCGFLVLHQETLARALPVPVATSSLLLVPLVDRLLGPGARAGVLTISAADLGPAHLAAAGAAPDTPIAGLAADSHFAAVFLRDGPTLDLGRARAELLAAADSLLAGHPEVGAIVLECTNMGPHAAALARHTGLAVFDVMTLASWLHQGLCPQPRPAPQASGTTKA
jgi:hypothetical protein